MSKLTWEDYRDAHNHLKFAADSASRAMMLAMADLPTDAHQSLMRLCLEKAAERMGYAIVKRVQEAA